MRFSIDPWDVDYGSSVDQLQPHQSSADVFVDTEVPAAEWRPMTAARAPTSHTVLFIDGVRRIDARIWIEDDVGDVHPGLCASYAAGAVRCDSTATVTIADVARGMFSTAPTAQDI